MRIFVTVLLLAASVLAQGLRVCHKCGVETKPGEKVCHHCRATLPPAPAAQPASPAPAVHPAPSAPAAPGHHPVAPAPGKPAPAVHPHGGPHPIDHLVRPEVDESLREARALRDKQPTIALCYYQNALALQRLLQPPSAGGNGTDAIAQGIREMQVQSQRGWVACPKCQGSGVGRLVMKKRDGHDSVGPMGKCPTCAGQGGAVGLLTADRARAAFSQGRREFDRREIAKGKVKLGQAYLSPAIRDRLTTQQCALVMSANPRPCDVCGLTGRQLCNACRGRGTMKCNAPDCENGQLRERRRGGSHGVVRATRMNDPTQGLCPVCRGTAEIPCKMCNGAGGVPCKKCGGNGNAPVCRKCDGTGAVTCGRCKGVGEVRGKPCDECRGQGVVLCRTCGGDGSK